MPFARGHYKEIPLQIVKWQLHAAPEVNVKLLDDPKDHTCACHMATVIHRGLTSPQMTCLPADPNMTL